MAETTIQELPIDRIISLPQARRDFDETKLVELAQTIRELGVQQPIRLRQEGDLYVIVFGERRWRASKLAGLSTIPAIVVDGVMSGPAILQAQLVENLQRADLGTLEKATAIQRYISEANLTAAQAASKLGLSPATVAKLLSIISLPETILAAVDAGTISLSGAYELSQITDPVQQQELASRLANGELTRDGLVGLRKASRKSVAPPPKTVRTSVTIILDRDRAMTLVGPGLTSIEGLIGWCEDMLAKARKARAQGLTPKTFARVLKEQAKA